MSEATANTAVGSLDAFAQADVTKLKELRSYLAGFNSLLIAYSGGVDSTLLAQVAHEVLGDHMLAVLASSPLLARGEEERARSIASTCDIPFEVIAHPGYENSSVRANPSDRCYLCKRSLFEELAYIATARGLLTADGSPAVACGDNASDLCCDRPGLRAAQECYVISPLAFLGIEKSQVRRLAQQLKLPNAQQPSSPCLATRFPTGCHLDEELLTLVRDAEATLQAAYDFSYLRVRCDAQRHARIEIDAEDLEALSLKEREDLCEILKPLRFTHIVTHPAAPRC